MERLVAEFCTRGLQVSTLKHAHHCFDVDTPGTDSFRHRAAGASQVLLASATRWALMEESRGTAQPTLAQHLKRMAPVDLILIEGWKNEPHPKIEVWRHATCQPLIATSDKTIRAIASDSPLDVNCPMFDLNDTKAIANFIAVELAL